MKNFFGKDMTDEEYDKIFEDYRQLLIKEKLYDKRQEKRIWKFVKKLSQVGIDMWMDKFLKWEYEYEEREYKKGIETHSRIFGHLVSLLNQKGKPIRIYKDEDFCTGGFQWNKYQFKLYQGQGSFWRIWKGKKEIFTNI